MTKGAGSRSAVPRSYVRSISPCTRCSRDAAGILSPPAIVELALLVVDGDHGVGNADPRHLLDRRVHLGEIDGALPLAHGADEAQHGHDVAQVPALVALEGLGHLDVHPPVEHLPEVPRAVVAA